MLFINHQQEVNKITDFIKKTLKKQGFEKVIIPVSGGIDSSTALLLLTKAIDLRNIIAVKLPYKKQDMKLADLAINQAGIPKKNIISINIQPAVKKIVSAINYDSSAVSRIRYGNIMARTRMIIVYDLSKKHSALACGTENKSEHMLGYFTRFGDQASDFEPIRHLYKTQIYQLAEYLEVPKEIIKQAPSAGLWKNQTDEKEFGFTYKQADQILYLHFEKKLPISKLKKKGLKNAKKIISWVKKNEFKQKAPYSLSSKL